MAKYHQGKFKPINPQKYKGDPTQIIYRSSWELKLLIILDKNPNVIEYSSEEIIIPYRSPIDNKIHRYFPDMYVKKRNHSDGKIECCLIEIKPRAQTIQPKPQTNITKRYLNEVKTWGVNSAKWDAAEEYCMKRGWKFIKMDEYDLGIQV